MINTQEHPEPGDLVMFGSLPQGFLDDPPKEDKDAISTMVGRAIRLKAYDSRGRVELEFTDGAGTTHTLYSNPDFIKHYSPCPQD
jgi:hypothetical protein